MPFKWSRQQIEKLIMCVEQNPCIYNINCKEYLDKTKRFLAFNAILEEIQTMESSMTLEEIKRKWKNLRTQYTQELRSINKAKKNGSDDEYVVKLWCFKQLNFLQAYSEPRESKDNTEVIIQDNNHSTCLKEERLSEEPPKKILKLEKPFKWSRQQIEKLIICFERNPCIYNIKSKDYLDRNKKAVAFNSILEEIQTMDSSMTLEEIKRKWKNLRTQYMQELRSINKSEKYGSGKVYVPKLWCFQQLNFLKSYSEIRESKYNPEEIQYKIYIDEESLNDQSSTKRQKSLAAFNDFRKDLDNFKNILSQRRSEKKFSWLGNLVAHQMEEISPEDQPDAAWQVQCLMQRLTSQSSEKEHFRPSI